MESGVPQNKGDFSFGKYTAHDGRSSVESLGKKSSDCLLLKHEIPEGTSDADNNLISTGEVFFMDFYKIAIKVIIF